MAIEHPFPPLYDKESRILILGSFPSVKSREQHFFYGHPQNRFWKTVAGVLSEEVPQTIEEKKAFLHRNHIAVWDVIHSCEIEGSSDSSIRHVVPNDLRKIFAEADIRAIYCNGAKSYEYYGKYQEKETGKKAVKLPSTSPANAAFSLERLQEQWKVICAPLQAAPAGIGEVLLRWYDYNARILPWRSDPTPYHVWVSEIMLQQTRVEAVKKYYARWMAALPDVRALAEIEEEKLMKLWEGLGYYNRARNLKAAAVTLMEEYDGELPDDYGKLLSLKGIGAYTAGAIASIAFGLPEPAVDGNVLRVFSRVLAESGDITRQAVKKRIEREVRRVLPEKRAGDFNQALMDLGSGVCLPNGEPLCDQCPWESICQAHKRGKETDFPVKAGKKARRIEEKGVFLIEIPLLFSPEPRTCCEAAGQHDSVGDLAFAKRIKMPNRCVTGHCVNSNEIPRWEGGSPEQQPQEAYALLLHKRPSGGLLPDLWEFPNESGRYTLEKARETVEEWIHGTGYGIQKVDPLGEGKHVFSHVEWHMTGYRFRLTALLTGQSVTKGNNVQPKERRAEALRKKLSERDGADMWALVSYEEAEEVYAIPSAFACYKKQMGIGSREKGGNEWNG